ncbi:MULTISPECIES: hypothetical protein [Alcaligenes]|jgi:hypothetical protein|uniref:PH domain-containing protein n=2 Tax=Alcaligenes TaxID=507 RepID=A0A3G2HZU8_9BURK|nr:MULTISPECIES: hypothetical protein [Alcaligenes]ASR88174.1 hypothetical protein AFA_01125 [Alcaligenes faecalis]AWG33854.1 hypothetical protein CA948_01220 [Alcaligenes aquatilis]AYN22614.1 hypothetical protein D3M96_00990 [Alcaligenes aquatilis]AYR22214.1 hypothetical protein D6I95_12635 [Alcaligenes faecalis]MCC9164902.1 hypothetical protein [Alcaligenes sp. MMA]
MSQAPSKEEIDALLKDLGSLPIQGRSWPKWVAAGAWIVLALIGVRFALVASSPQGAAISPVLAGSLVLLFTGLILIAWHMWHGITTIDQNGIRQSWIMKREVQWQDIHFAKFVPLFNSKRLICFTRRGRPVIFQGATQDLQVAFAKISLVLRRKN